MGRARHDNYRGVRPPDRSEAGRRLMTAAELELLTSAAGEALLARAAEWVAGGHAVVAVDRNELHARLAAFNTRAREIPGQVWPVVGELPAFLPGVEAAFLDPGRREGGARTRSLAGMSPPIAAVVELAGRI